MMSSITLGDAWVLPYQDSRLAQMLADRQALGLPRILLASDIDNTFVSEALHTTQASHDLMQSLAAQSIPVMYVTGNALASVCERIESGELPPAAVIAPCVGTELWVRQHDGSYARDDRFAQELRATQYNRAAIVHHAYEWLRKLAKTHADLAVVFQDARAEQLFVRTGVVTNHQEYKVSFHFFAHNYTQVTQLQQLAESTFGVTALVCEEINYNATLTDPHAARKYCLDLVPVTKAYVVAYVRELCALSGIIVAGDSGNDLHMLTESGDVSIVVGGAQPSLRVAIDTLLTEAFHDGNFSRATAAVSGVMFYRESGERLGPQSIQHALTLLAGSSSRLFGVV